MTGIERIAAERKRQIEVEGWTPEHDAQHVEGELARAAAVYAKEAAWQASEPTYLSECSVGWPSSWDEAWFKPSTDPIRNLEKAGALIAAEIDRIQAVRAAQQGG